MSQAISNRQLYPAIAGGVLVALACGVVLKLVHMSQADPATESQSSARVVEAEVPPSSTPFESGPFLQAAPSFRLANPVLLQSTSSNARLETVAAGRPDPFAPILRPSVVPPQPRPAQVTSTPVPAQVSPVQTLPVIPVAATQTLPPLPTLPTPALSGSVPSAPGPQDPGNVAVSPSATLQSLVDQIVVTGVAQIGDTVSVIIKEPGSTSSRHAQPGELIAGGQVRLKSVDTSTAEPIVVLTYNGQDYTRTVGSSALIGSL